MGNVRSVAKAFELLGNEMVISNKTNDIKKAAALILPGVGAFADGMKHLEQYGLIDILSEEVVKNKKPLLGICLGMQLLAKTSEEFGLHQGLGWLDAEVKPFRFENQDLKVPHVGWNDIQFKEGSPLFRGLRKDPVLYFVHSYHLVCPDNIVIAECNYGYKFVAAIQQNNIFATQFHPEKSQTVGLKILNNFVNYCSEN